MQEYEASGGKELFISIEEPEAGILIGYLRLRMPSEKAHRPEVDAASAIIRELHVYGPEVPVGLRDEDAWQHTGLGRKLLNEAEIVARERGASRILVLSALGTKGYYKRAGYYYAGPYMGKMLN
jgi:elongator complex protein 3